MKSLERFYFKSSINIWVEILLWTIITFICSSVIFTYNNQDQDLFVLWIFQGLIIGFLLWIRYDTYYILTSDYLYYRNGPIRGKIAIKNITKMKSHKGIMIQSLLKPALGYDGIYLYYNKFDDIYISPLEKEKFKKSLMRINANIINLD
jgi:hypothetical protein